jgi:hypothetical protein
MCPKRLLFQTNPGWSSAAPRLSPEAASTADRRLPRSAPRGECGSCSQSAGWRGGERWCRSACCWRAAPCPAARGRTAAPASAGRSTPSTPASTSRWGGVRCHGAVTFPAGRPPGPWIQRVTLPEGAPRRVGPRGPRSGRTESQSRVPGVAAISRPPHPGPHSAHSGGSQCNALSPRALSPVQQERVPPGAVQRGPRAGPAGRGGQEVDFPEGAEQCSGGPAFPVAWAGGPWSHEPECAALLRGPFSGRHT